MVFTALNWQALYLRFFWSAPDDHEIEQSVNLISFLEEKIANENYKTEEKENFENLKPKTYAVVCYHDSNENGKMDFQDNGMPIEDYGATNNIFNYGPPQFSDAKFELIDKDLTFEIKF